jgi:hypothetical protein
MKIAILAAGGKNWNRIHIEVEGENILGRLIRQLTERGVAIEDIFLSLNKAHARSVFGRIPGRVSHVVNDLTGNDLGCIKGISHLEFDFYLFGDVFYTDDAIDQILKGETEFYGRSKPGQVKNYGEMFAMKATPRFMETLDRMWNEYQAGTRKRLWSWDLYSEIQGKDFYKHRNTGNFTEINDETEDFDKPEDVEAWSIRFNKKASPESQGSELPKI